MSVPKITSAKPAGQAVLVEVLTAQELMGTILTVAESTDPKVPLQGYVIAVGPVFKKESWGFDVGDRVLISGSGVMAPSYDNCERDRFLMEPNCIKSVLEEADEQSV